MYKLLISFLFFCTLGVNSLFAQSPYWLSGDNRFKNKGQYLAEFDKMMSRFNPNDKSIYSFKSNPETNRVDSLFVSPIKDAGHFWIESDKYAAYFFFGAFSNGESVSEECLGYLLYQKVGGKLVVINSNPLFFDEQWGFGSASFVPHITKDGEIVLESRFGCSCDVEQEGEYITYDLDGNRVSSVLEVHTELLDDSGDNTIGEDVKRSYVDYLPNGDASYKVIYEHYDGNGKLLETQEKKGVIKKDDAENHEDIIPHGTLGPCC